MGLYAGPGFIEVGRMSEEQAHSVLATIASCRQTVINHDHPILETELPLNGARFEGILPPVVHRPVFAIRMRPRVIPHAFAAARLQPNQCTG